MKEFNPKCWCNQCFGYEDGKCLILSSNNFGGRKCPFYKTREQILAEEERAAKVLRDLENYGSRKI